MRAAACIRTPMLQQAVRSVEAVVRDTAPVRAPRTKDQARPAATGTHSTRPCSRQLAKASHNRQSAAKASPALHCSSPPGSRTTRPPTRWRDHPPARQRAKTNSAPKRDATPALISCDGEYIDAGITAALESAQAQESARQRSWAAKRWLESDREARARTDAAAADMAQRRRAVAKREAQNTRAQHKQHSAAMTIQSSSIAESNIATVVTAESVGPSLSKGRLCQAPQARYAVTNYASNFASDKSGRAVAEEPSKEALRQDNLRRIGPPRRPVRSVTAPDPSDT